MFKRVTSAEDIKHFFGRIGSFLPYSAAAYYAAKLSIEGGYSNVDQHIFAYPWPKANTFCVLQKKCPAKGISVYFWTEHPENESEFLPLLQGMEIECPDLFLNDQCEFTMPAVDLAMWGPLCSRLSNHGCITSLALTDESYRVNMYYVPDNKRNSLLETPVKEPLGYYFDRLSADDAQNIHETWKFAGQRSDALSNLKVRISILPNICLRDKQNGQAVSWELLHNCGMMTHLYTLPEYRGKGLAKLVEKKFAQTLAEQGIIPFKYVETDNPVAIQMTESAFYWQSSRCPVAWLNFIGSRYQRDLCIQNSGNRDSCCK